MNRRQFLVAGAMLTTAISLGARGAERTTNTSGPATKPDIPDDVVWHDVREWGIEGRAFADTEGYFDRLPARAKGIVPPSVWSLSHDTAGMSVRFEADAPILYVRYRILNASLAMAHMPAVGVSGLDLYAEHEKRWHFLAHLGPASQNIAARFKPTILPGRRAYQINFPLYNGVTSFEVGTPAGAAFAPIAPRKAKPVVWYGTSITQGGCASRPGMAFPAILARRLDRPHVNLGFSGSGKMEESVMRFLVEIDAAVFALDCLANMSAEQVRERVEPGVRIIREKHAKTPILLLESRNWQNALLAEGLMKLEREKAVELKRAYDTLRDAGAENLHYCAADDFLGSDGEATVDGSHPTDLGMMRYADALEPVLREIIT